MKTTPVQVGLIFGLLLGLFHAFWAAPVAVGWAQPVLDFIVWAHFISPPYRIDAFDFGRAAILVRVTFTIGLIMGMAGTLILVSKKRTLKDAVPFSRLANLMYPDIAKGVKCSALH